MQIFNRLESEVRGYIRSFPTVFTKARGALLTDENGDEYIDFLSGAGTLNYGHNNPLLKKKLIAYLTDDGLTHGLDMASQAKANFLETFERVILKPRNMDYKIQFPGPTGTNAVEAALKLARKVKGRNNVISFTNAFHGVSLGSLSATGNTKFRSAAGIGLANVTFMPYDGYLGEEVDTTAYLDKVLTDQSSGVDLPAAVIVETVQGEGGVNEASFAWLRALEAVCRKHDVLLIVDDIQMGCGRTGTFFSFDDAGISPDIITLSKSISGYGLPMALVLMKPELDVWEPGAHNGTFRGHNLAFVTAREAILAYWQNDAFQRQIAEKENIMRAWLEFIKENYPEGNFSVRGRGMVQGLAVENPELAGKITSAAFDNALIIETSGSRDQVIKFLPPLVIEDHQLIEGLKRFEKAVADALKVGAVRSGDADVRIRAVQ